MPSFSNFFLKIRNLELRTPFLLSSGTWGLGDVSIPNLEVVSALITKGISRHPMPGNPPPRLSETPCGLINSIGLENPGLEVFLEKYLPKLKALGRALIVNLHGESLEDFFYLAERLESEEVEGLELNISCPNVTQGGIAFSESPTTVYELVKGVRRLFSRALLVKLSPRSPVKEIVKACESAGADALTIANTYPALSVLSLKPFRVLCGGLSGPAIKPLTLRLVYELSRRTDLPILASGGVMSGRDALEYLLCGAKAVQIGTALLVDPDCLAKIYKEFFELSQEISWEP